MRASIVLALFTASATTGLAAIACGGPMRTARAPAPGEQPIRVVSYNVNYGLAGDRATFDAIFASGADIISLQETTPRWERLIRTYAPAEYVEKLFHDGPGAGGLALLSKWPVSDIEYRDAPAPGWFPAGRYLVEVRGQPIQVLAVHLRPPVSDSGSFVKGYFQSDEVHRVEIAAHAKLIDPVWPTIVLGDFNEDEGGDAIEWLEARGFENALPLYAPEAHTWRWDTWLGEITSNLDHVLFDRRLEAISARVDERGRSDHLPVVVDLVRLDQPKPVAGDAGGPPPSPARRGRSERAVTR